jgi:hypothetical protein
MENLLNFNSFTANIGLRLANYSVNKTNYFAAEPRISLNYTINDKISINYSYTLNPQVKIKIKGIT